MKFGLSYNTAVAGTDPANLKAIARHADDLGFESFYVPEHVTLYPGARVGEVEFAPDLPIADPLERLAFVAASTTTILLGTGVLLLPFHHPVGLAKRLATIDVLSSGRMRLLTIGVSSLPGARPPPSESITRPGAAAPTRRSTSCALSGRATPPARVSTASSTRSRT
jgi:alkanesulfonate monooxygenase SsuD/methylene tetrahydromethanopterin reductase-like flavin-dependent oxidoreductase (luciferase family)